MERRAIATDDPPRVALTPTLYTFDVVLSDVDRGVYQDGLSFRVACHPSETREFFLTRVLAYLLEHTDGIAFSNDLSAADQPAVSVRDLTGTLLTWIDVGMPDADRLHKALKQADRVAVYTHRDPEALKRQLGKRTIHRADELLIFAVDQTLLAGLVGALDRRNKWDVSVSDRQVYVTVGGKTHAGGIVEHRLA